MNLDCIFAEPYAPRIGDSTRKLAKGPLTRTVRTPFTKSSLGNMAIGPERIKDR